MYKIINWYVSRFAFPKKGWKYFKVLLQLFGLRNRIYKKKLFHNRFMYVNAVDHIQKEIFWYGEYDKLSSRVWQQFVRKDDIVLDIGANIGYYTILAADKATSGHVYSFEPVSTIRGQLLKNVAVNKFTNVHVLPFCAGNSNEVLTMYLAANDNTGMSGLRTPENYSGKTERVTSVILDEWYRLSGIKSITLVKIDIEGAERRALEGMKTIFEQCKPVVFIEIIASHLAKFGNSAEDVYSYFSALYYGAYEIIQDDLVAINDYKEGYDIVFLPKGYVVPG